MAKVYESTKQAIARYRRDKTKSFTMTFFPGDMPLYEHLQSQPNKSAYIKALIAADMEPPENDSSIIRPS